MWEKRHGEIITYMVPSKSQILRGTLRCVQNPSRIRLRPIEKYYCLGYHSLWRGPANLASVCAALENFDYDFWKAQGTYNKKMAGIPVDHPKFQPFFLLFVPRGYGHLARYGSLRRRAPCRYSVVDRS